jgi:hypothetical protein
MRRGQIAMEFVAACVLLIVVWTSFSTLAEGWNRRAYSVVASNDGQALLDRICTEAINAKASGPGYSHEFAIPGALAGNRNYSFGLFPAASTIEIYFQDSSASSVLPFGSFAGNVTCCSVKVTNENGTVVFS